MPNVDLENDIRRFITRGTGNQVPANKSLYDLIVTDRLDNATYGNVALKTLIDAVKGKTDALPSDPADESLIEAILSIIRTELTFQHQAPAALAQSNPVQNTWYTVLNTTANVRMYQTRLYIETTGETLEVELTIDGQTITGSLACTADTTYLVYLQVYGSALKIYTEASLYWPMSVMPLEGRSVRVRVRKTTANGTGTLYCDVTYAKR